MKVDYIKSKLRKLHVKWFAKYNCSLFLYYLILAYLALRQFFHFLPPCRRGLIASEVKMTIERVARSLVPDVQFI